MPPSPLSLSEAHSCGASDFGVKRYPEPLASGIKEHSTGH
jgi:hypothetical protein